MSQRSKEKSPRVVISGLGVISALGIGKDEFWKKLIAGKTGIKKIRTFDTTPYDRHYAGEIRGFDPSDYIPKKSIHRMGRTSQYAVAASKMALKDAKLKLAEVPEQRIGVCLGTTMGEMQVLEKFSDRHVPKGDYTVDLASAFTFPTSLIPTNVAVQLKLNSHNFMFANACAAGNYAIGYSYDLIKLGSTDMMLAGGADSLSRIAFTGFHRLLAMAPEKCQPFDKNRKGMMVGEGAGVLLLETLKSAKKRGAPIYAEILGYGVSNDAHHMTNPSYIGIANAMNKSLKFSGVTADQIDYISAHGTGTPENDKAECHAIYDVFGKRAKKIPISSIKSMLGHAMGASSALESIACCLALKNKEIPPTINFEEADPNCEIDCVPNKSRKQDVNIICNNSEAFGGNNACVVLEGVNKKNF